MHFCKFEPDGPQKEKGFQFEAIKVEFAA